MNFKFYRKVNEDGTIPGSQDIRDAVKSFFGKEIEIVIRKKTKKRTNDQNEMFWAYMTMIGNDLGYTKNEMYKLAVGKFLTEETIIEKTGEIILTTKKTSELNTKEFGVFIDRIIEWASVDFGIVFPTEGQQVEIGLEDDSFN